MRDGTEGTLEQFSVFTPSPAPALILRTPQNVDIYDWWTSASLA